ncbi:hypothetical protein J7J13_02880 [bacterium]|nr:hypothetical protein [bacterium]
MKVKEKIIFLFKTKLGWRLIAGTTFITIGIIAIFISPDLKSNTDLISGTGFTFFILGGILVYEPFTKPDFIRSHKNTRREINEKI